MNGLINSFSIKRKAFQFGSENKTEPCATDKRHAYHRERGGTKVFYRKGSRESRVMVPTQDTELKPLDKWIFFNAKNDNSQKM